MRSEIFFKSAAANLAILSARAGKLGLFLALFMTVSVDILLKARGIPVDEHQLAFAAAPAITLFAILAAAGELVANIFFAPTRT